MTIASSVSRWPYTGNGTTGPFAYTTKIFAKTDLKVYVNDVLKTVDTHYTVSVGDSGNVTFTAGNEPANGASVVIVKDVPLTQGTSLPLGGALPSTALEAALDKLTILVQQVYKRVTGRVLRQPDSDATDLSELPAAADRAGKILGFDSNGQPSASAISLPLTLTATYYARVNAAGDAYELRSPSQVRSDLSLVVGTNVQAWDATLDTWAGKDPPSGDVVGTDDTQILENKTLVGAILQGGVNADTGSTLDYTLGTVKVSDSGFEISDNSDSTKIAKFEVSGITTGTTRTITVPDSDVTLIETESGSFTPTLGGSSTAGTQTYSTQTGRYRVFDDLVWFCAVVVMTAKDAATSGNLTLFGLPFTALNVSLFQPGVALSRIVNLTMPASRTGFEGRVVQNTSTAQFAAHGSNTSLTALTQTELNATTAIIVSGWYLK